MVTVDAVAQAKDVALLLDPLLAGVGDALLDTGMADGFERAGKVAGVRVPQPRDDRATARIVRLVPHGDVGLSESLQVFHAGDMILMGDMMRGLPIVDDGGGN